MIGRLLKDTAARAATAIPRCGIKTESKAARKVIMQTVHLFPLGSPHYYTGTATRERCIFLTSVTGEPAAVRIYCANTG